MLRIAFRDLRLATNRQAQEGLEEVTSCLARAGGLGVLPNGRIQRAKGHNIRPQ